MVKMQLTLLLEEHYFGYKGDTSDLQCLSAKNMLLAKIF